jgi:hypothetical protein
MATANITHTGNWKVLPSGVKVQSTQLVNTVGANQYVSVLPRSSPSSAGLQAGSTQVIFDLPRGLGFVDYVNGLYLCSTVGNSHAASQLDVVDALSMIQSIDISVNGNIVQTLYGQALRKNLLLQSDSDRLDSLCSMAYISAKDGGTYNSTLDIAALGTAYVMAPIFETIFQQSQLPMWLDFLPWRITFNMATGAANLVRSTSVATITSLTWASVSLLVSGQVVSSAVRIEDEASLRNGLHLFKYMDSSLEVLNLGAVTSGTVTQNNFTGVGMLANMHVDLQRTPLISGDQSYTPIALTSFELLQAGSVISHQLGDNGFLYDIWKGLATELYPSTELLTAKFAAIINFSEHPTQTLASGSGFGYRKTTGTSEVVRVTPAASNAAALINAYCYWYSGFVLDYDSHAYKIYRKNVD